MTATQLTAVCPSCGFRSESVPAQYAGKNVRCPRCQTSFRVAPPAGVRPAPAPTRFEEAPATTPEPGPLEPLPTTPEGAAVAAPVAAPSLRAVAAEWRVGEIVSGLYEVTAVLGQGGMGRVYKVRHRGWDMDLAVKTPLPQILEAVGGASAFEREAETWVNLGLHPLVVTCYYVRRLAGVPRVFAEFVDGGSLHDGIRAGRFYSLEKLLDVAIQFAWGLHYAHEQGLVHRDVKPANVLLSVDGQVKVTDFGLARAGRLEWPALGVAAAAQGGTLAVAGGAAGTPAYMSPEQLGGETLTRRSDVWSYALSVLEMFRGERNWDYGSAAAEVLENYLAQAPQAGRPRLPASVATLFGRCFQNDPGQRPHDLAEVAALLCEAYAAATGRAYPRPEPRAGRGSADSLSNRAVSLLDLDRSADASPLWEQALVAEPQHLEATFNRAVHEWSVGRLDDGELTRRVAEALKSHEKEARAHQLSARVALALGDFARVLPALDAAAKLGTPETELARDRAMALAGQAAGRDDAASRTLVRNAFFQTLQPADSDAELPLELEAKSRSLVPGQERLTTLRGLTGAALAITLTPDGKEIIAGGGGREARVWDMATGAPLRKLVSEDGRLRSLAVTPEGVSLVWVAEAAPVRVFELSQGRVLRSCARTGGSPLCLALSPDGSQAIVGASDRTLRVFEIASGRLVRTLEGHDDAVFAVAAAGSRIVSGGRDGSVRVWDAASGASLAVHRGHIGRVNAVAIDAARRRLVSAGEDKSVRLWPWDGESAAEVLLGATQAVTSLALDPSGRFLASGSLDRGLRLVEFESRRLFALVRLDAAVHALVPAAGGFVVGHGSMLSRVGVPEHSRVPSLALVRPLGAGESQQRQAEFDERLRAGALHREAGDLAKALDAVAAARAVPGFARADAALAVWDEIVAGLPHAGLRAAWEEHTLAGHTDQVLAVAAGAGGRIASAGTDRSVRMAMASALAEVLVAGSHEAPVAALAFSPDGRRLVSGSWDQTLRISDTGDGRVLATCRGHEGYVLGVAVSNDGRRLASASLDQTLRLWRSDGSLERVLAGHLAAASTVAFSPDGRVLVSGGWDATLRVWNPDTGAEIAVLAGHRGNVNAVATAPAGVGLASGGADGSVRLWDAQARRQTAELRGHSAEVMAVAFFPDGRYLVSASRDASVRLWNVGSGACERVLTHPAPVLAAAVGPRGERLVTGGADRLVRLWHLDWQPVRPEAKLRFKPQTLRIAASELKSAAPPSVVLRQPGSSETQWDDVRKRRLTTVFRKPAATRQPFPWKKASLVAAALLIVGFSVRAWLGVRPGLHLVQHLVTGLRSEPDLIQLASFRAACDGGGPGEYLERVRADEVSAPDLACLASFHDPGTVGDYFSTMSLAAEDPLRAKRLYRNAVSLMVGLGEPAVEALCGALGDASNDVRRVASIALSVQDTPGSRACLLRTMTSGGSVPARVSALEALPKLLALGHPGVREGALLVEKLLADREPAVRAAALGTLAILSQDFAKPLAEAARQDGEASVRQAAEGALGAIASARQGEALAGEP